MKKLFTLLIAALMVFAFAGAAQADFKDMWANVYSWDGTMNGDGTLKLTRLTSGVTFKVLQADSDTAETLYEYNDDTMTSLTNPVTTANFTSATVCDDKVAFRVDPGESGDAEVDLIVVDTAGGYTAFVEDFTENVHSIVIDERPNILHHGCIWYAASDNTETDTGIDFDYDTQILDVIIESVTIDASETIDVGLLSTETNGDANGLRAAVSITTSSEGYVKDTGVITNGSTSDYFAATTYGALLVTAITGSDGAATSGGKSYIGHTVVSAKAKSLTYTGSAGSDTAAGYIHYWFTRTR